MSTPSTEKVHQVAVLVFDGVDILDFSGPTEILANATYSFDMLNPRWAFKVQLVAATPTITAGRCMTVKPEMTVGEAIQRVDDFDVLVVPGGMPDRLLQLAKENGPEVQFIQAFNSKRETGDQKVILSVCTGALLLAATGVLQGLKATTHHWAYDMLRGLDDTIDVVKTVGHGGEARYVDSGISGNGVRIVTAGGVSCGMDAALYVTELKVGREAATREAAIEELEWKRAEM